MSDSGPADPTDGKRGTDGKVTNPATGARARRRPPIRAIDPATSKRSLDREAPLPALYLSDRLLRRNGAGLSRDLDLRQALAKLDLTYEVTSPAADRPRDLESASWGTSITLSSTTSPIDAIDAWAVLQQLRVADPSVAEDLSLEHVLRPADGYWGGIGGYWGGIGGYWGGIGGYWGGIAGSALQEYSVPGRGGRMPVSLALPDPARRAHRVDRHPVIAVPDTEIAEHPWFKDGARVVRLRMKNGRLVPSLPSAEIVGGGGDPATPPTDAAVQADPPGLLRGHATFIAGLIRQGCPEATIVSIPVMGDDGIVDEGVMLDVLEALLDRHIQGQEHNRPAEVVDVLSLSVGYYAEDSKYTSGPVADMLDRFAERGVAVVAGVGNDGTSSPFVPAALAAAPPTRIRPTSVPPLASVGACNPDGTTVALFSNNLAVVSAVRLGVSIVSTLPLTNGMGQPSSKISADGTVRCTVDPDDYTGGFGVWSGTSFAAPVFAAELAVALVEERDMNDLSPKAMRGRAIRALRTCIGKKTP